MAEDTHATEGRLLTPNPFGAGARSHIGDSGPLVFEGDINALLAEGVRAAYVAHRCAFVITEGPLTSRRVAGPEEGR